VSATRSSTSTPARESTEAQHRACGATGVARHRVDGVRGSHEVHAREGEPGVAECACTSIIEERRVRFDGDVFESLAAGVRDERFEVATHRGLATCEAEFEGSVAGGLCDGATQHVGGNRGEVVAV
jgi:hypothetical protein